MTAVLQLHASAGLYGGESVILALSGALRDRGVTPVVGCVAIEERGMPELGRKAEELGFEVHYFPTRRSISLGPVRSIRRLLRARGIRLVHAHGYKSNLLGGLATIARRVPVVTTNHLHPMMPLDDRKLQRYGQFDVRVTARLLDRIVAVSEDIRMRLMRDGVPARKVSVIENGIDIASFAGARDAAARAVREALGVPAEGVLIGSLARLTPQKGQAFLLDALARLAAAGTPFHLLVAGDGPLRGALEAQAGEAGLAGRVHFLGFRRDTRALLGAMDIFVLSSIEEGLPMAMLEAMAAGVPVVTTAVGDIPKVIRDGQNGRLVPAGDAASLAAALGSVVRDRGLRDRLASEAYATVVAGYSQAAMGDKYLGLYRALCPGAFP